MRCLLSEHRVPQHAWASFLPHVQMALNSAKAEATGRSPNELVFGQQLAAPIDHALDAAPGAGLGASSAAARAVEWTSLARSAISWAQAAQARYANRRQTDLSFAEGE